MKPFYAQKVHPKGHKIGMRKYITKGPFEDKHYWSSYAHNTFNLSLPYVLPVCTIYVFFYYLCSSPNSPLSCFSFLFFLEVEDFNITFKSTQSYSLADQTALLLEYKLNQQGPSTGLPKAFHLLPLCIRLQCLQLSVSKDIKTLFHMLLLANGM